MKKLLKSLLCMLMIFANVTLIQAESTIDALNEVIKQAGQYNEAFYSYDSYSAFEDALKTAKSLDASAEQETIDAAKVALEEAITALVPRYENLALNKTVTVSSQYNDSKAGSYATDGDTNTRWGNNYSANSYKNGNHEELITVDLGAMYDVDAVRIQWESAYASSYTIQGSTNGGDFFDLKEVDGKGRVELHTGLDTKIRYVRLALHEAAGKYGYSIWELEVYERSPIYTVYENVALTSEVSVSSAYERADFAKEHLNDGDPLTRWGSNYLADPAPEVEYAVLDFGQVRDVDYVYLTFEAAHATAYKVQASNDGVEYHDITETLTGSAGLQAITNLNTSTQYLKFVFMEASGQYGYSVYEIEVYEANTKTLDKAINGFETELAKYSVGNELGNLHSSDYATYETLLNEAKALKEDENAKNIDINYMIETLVETTPEIANHLVDGNPTADIYPKPQYIEVTEGSGMYVKGTVDILVHGEQDEATLPKLYAMLEANELSYQEVETLGENPAIILANKCSDEGCTICKALEDTNSVLTNKQAYLLKSEDGVVTIIGSDADGVYYGVMSLAQMFEQKSADGRIAEVMISDYPDVEFRGYVEGYYGIPWSYDDRAKLFEDTTKYKMTTYIYAPKDDPYHRSQWRDTYPEDKAAEMTALSEVAHANNMEFCWTIHPGADYDYTTDSDGDGVVDDYQALIDKFEQVYSFGVRQFGIFYDDLDYSVADGMKHSQTINDAYEYLTSKYDDVKPFITVVTRYTNSWGAPWDTYFTPFMQNIHEDTIVLWTGQSTMSAITKAYMEVPKTKTGVDRDFGVWWNYPVTDYAYGHLFVGSLDCLYNDVDNINSFFLNPMPEADASKVAIYSGADYAWNTAEFESTSSWKRAIKELVPEANEAFERFADNVSYIDKGNGFFFDESKYMKDDMADFLSAIADGYTDGENATMKAHFAQMVEDSEALLHINDTELQEEISNFVKAYRALANAGLSLMKAYDSAAQGNIDETLTYVSQQQAYINESASYKVRKLNNKSEFITVGGYRIQPFLADADELVFETLGQYAAYNVPTRMITNVDLLNTKEVSYVKASYVVNDITANMKANDYVGIALANAANIYQIKADVSDASKVKLQYSLNGIEWIDAESTVEGNVVTSTNIVTAAYARLVANEDVELVINSFSMMPSYEPASVNVSTNLPTYQTYTIDKALDGDLTTNFWSSTGSSAGSNITVDLGAVAILNKVEVYNGINKHGGVDAFDVTNLEVSTDGNVWQKVASKALAEHIDVDSTMKKIVFEFEAVEARYFRIAATSASESWAKLYEIVYDAEYKDYENHLVFDTNMTVAEDSKAEAIFDGNNDTYALYQNAVADSYVQIDLGTLVALYDVNVAFDATAKFNDVKLQVSTDGNEWNDAGSVVASDAYVTANNVSKANMQANGALARYIRFVTSQEASDVKIYEVKYNQTVVTKAEIKSVSTNMSTYQSYAIANAKDGRLDTKFYASEAIEKDDYVLVDFGSTIMLYDTSIYFGGDPNNSESFDGFKKMNVQVSADAKNWTTVKSMTSSEYMVVGGRYIANCDLGGVDARYLRFISTEASSSWLQVYEVQANNKVNTNALRYVDGLGTVKISNSNALDDGNFTTYGYMYEVDSDNTLIYPMNRVTDVTSIGIFQASDYISNATVSVQDAEGNWSDVGTLDQIWTNIAVNKKLQAVKLTFDGTIQPIIYEIMIMGYADYARVDQAISLVPTDATMYTDESLAAVDEAVNAVELRKEITDQLTVDAYANAINDAIRGLEVRKADYASVEAAIAKANEVKEDAIDFSGVQAAIDAVVYDLDFTKQEEVEAYAQAILDAIDALQYKPTEVKNLVAEAVDYKTIQLSWNVVEGATTYIVERLSGEEWIEVATTTESTYTATGVKTGKAYTYRVKADNADYSNEATATTTLSGDVELTIAMNGTTKFDLSWTTVEGATRYIIYRKPVDGEWKKILTLGKDVRNYTTKDMADGTYVYQVKAARYDSVDRVMTAGSNLVEATATTEAEAFNLTATKASDNSVTLTWNKLPNMKYYEVYRAIGEGQYRLLKRTTATSTTNASLKAGKTYNYKVRAYNIVNDVKVYTEFTNEVSYTVE